MELNFYLAIFVARFFVNIPAGHPSISRKKLNIMKKLLILILLTLPLMMASSSPQLLSSAKVSAVVSYYRHCEGVETVRIGRLATGALKMVAGMATAGDQDAKDALLLMKGVKALTVFEYEDCEQSLREEISMRLEKALSHAELLMEAKDGGEKMFIYGSVNDKKGTISNLMLFTPSDYALISVSGTVSLDAVAKLAAND